MVTTGRIAALLVMAALTGAAWGQAADGGDVRPAPGRAGFVGRMFELRATGHGEVSVAPDLAVVQLGASEQAKGAVEAQSKVNDILRTLVDKIKAAGIPAEKIQTARLELQPVYSDRPKHQEQPEVIGYRATSTVRIEISALDKIGDVVDAALSAGGNNFEGVSFQLKDDRTARADALKKAVADAKSKAEAMADAAGVKLVTLTDIAESSSGPIYPTPMFGARMAMAPMAAGGGTPVSPGEVKVSGDVTLVYQIAPAAPAGR